MLSDELTTPTSERPDVEIIKDTKCYLNIVSKIYEENQNQCVLIHFRPIDLLRKIPRKNYAI